MDKIIRQVLRKHLKGLPILRFELVLGVKR